MTTRHTIVALSCVIGLASSRNGYAIQRKHHPWFSHSSSKVTETTTPDVVSESAPKEPSSNPTDSDGNKVVKQALRYKGTRYKFGGSSTRGVDCSGLVTRVWEDLKMKKIPRASNALYKSGTPVHLAELRPGDLVFFKNTYRHGISHVGVYTGDNKFVHAAGHSKGVTITKLSDPYYQLHYAGARRLY